jgi:glycosyltransferase involved in cell wall biosynthesis
LNITIVSYTFPPSNEIGGRRWAKFSMFLSQLGHNVTVVCADNGGDKEWYEHAFKGVKIEILPKFYPEWLYGVNLSFQQKVCYFIQSKAYKLFLKSNLFDRAKNWKKPLLERLEKIHKENPIDFIVTTGGPFSILYFGTLFKQKYSAVKLISDLRDPWTWGVLYGIPNMTTRQKKYQHLLENMVVRTSDIVSYPTESMGNFLREKYSAIEKKLYLLPHAYDPSKFEFLRSSKNRTGFIYGGTIYDGLLPVFEKLVKMIEKGLMSDFNWDIFTNQKYELFENPKVSSYIRVKHFIPEAELFSKISNAKAYLLFFPESEKDLISTKFYEIIFTKTPIIYVGEEGAVSKFIIDNKVGVHIRPEDIEFELPKYINGEIKVDFTFFDVGQYSFPIVTQAFAERLLKSNTY